MSRLMGDATHDNLPALAAIAGSLQLVAGYDTGTPDIQWTPADWARFPGLTRVHIDQGFTGSPNSQATVRDVEYGAWTPGRAVNRAGWDVPRPTIYCTTGETGYNLETVLEAGWRGDLWLAIPGWQPGQPLPPAPGCTVVAVQNQSSAAYDLSAVLDPYWPEEAPMIGIHNGWAYCVKCAGMFFTNGQPANGTCPAGGQHETHSDAGFPYAIPYSS